MKSTKTRSSLTSKKALQTKTPLKQNSALKSKDKPVKQKKPDTTLLKKKADDWFSWYVRLRDCDFDGQSWVGKCITCNKKGVVAYLDPQTAQKRATKAIRFNSGWDAGHFVSRGHWITRFEEENVNLQCSMACNKMKSGNRDKYRVELRLKYGDESPARLEALADENPKYKPKKSDLLEVIEDSKQQIWWFERTGV